MKRKRNLVLVILSATIGMMLGAIAGANTPINGWVIMFAVGVGLVSTAFTHFYDEDK